MCTTYTRASIRMMRDRKKKKMQPRSICTHRLWKQGLYCSRIDDTPVDSAQMAVFARKFDYAIIGAGASGMSFLDTLMRSHPKRDSLRVALIDPHAQAGGHWNMTTRLSGCTNLRRTMEWKVCLGGRRRVRDAPELRALEARS